MYPFKHEAVVCSVMGSICLINVAPSDTVATLALNNIATNRVGERKLLEPLPTAFFFFLPHFSSLILLMIPKLQFSQ